MKNQNKTMKFVFLLVAVVLLVGMLAACSKNSGGSDSTTNGASDNATTPASSSENTKIAPDGITLKWFAPDRSHAEGPLRDDWKSFVEIAEKTGVSIKFESAPFEGADEKRQIMMATNSVTDIFNANGIDFRTQGPDGVFLNLGDYLDIAPNLKKHFEEYPEAEALATGLDGGLYFMPKLTSFPEHGGFNFVWYMRHDLMKEHQLQPPTNTDELYGFLKELKSLYPKSYPLTFRTALNVNTGLFTVIGRAFTGIEGFINLDQAQGKYVFAPYHEGYKDGLIYMNKLYTEGLLDPEFALLTSAQWYERLQSGQSMVSYFWKSSLSAMNDAGKQTSGEQFDMNAIPPIAAEGIENYQFGRDIVGDSGIGISANTNDKEKAVRFLDYLYSEEGTNYLSLGILGETYELNEEGTPVYLEKFFPTPLNTLRRDYGVGYDGVVNNFGPLYIAWETGYDERDLANEEMYRPFVKVTPKKFLKTEEELDLEKSKLDNLNQYLMQEISKFVMGDIPINDDTYQKMIDQAKKLGADELVEMNNTAYERTYGGN